MHSTDPSLKILRLKWLLIALIGVLLWLSFFSWLRTWWETPNPLRWLFVASLALVYLLWILWHSLPHNHRHDESDILASLGLGNILSIARGYILVLFCGFLFSPWPDLGWTAWLPGVLYTLAALPDFVDGIAARLTNHVTKLGESLDVSIDSLGVLSVSLLSVQYGQVPWWYLLVGLARYIFLAGIWLRQKMDLPVYDLPYSVRRRGYAALAMGLFFVILYPVFSPPSTHLVAGIFAIYILSGFIWDWLVTIGWLPAQPGERYLRVQNWIVAYLPVLLRVALVLLNAFSFYSGQIAQVGSALFWLYFIALLCLTLGIAGRTCAVITLVVLGIYINMTPIQVVHISLFILYTNLLFLGTGKYSLWPIEDRLIYYRIGDQS